MDKWMQIIGLDPSMKKLVEKQRRTCFLPEGTLKDCEYCGAACGKAAV